VVSQGGTESYGCSASYTPPSYLAGSESLSFRSLKHTSDSFRLILLRTILFCWLLIRWRGHGGSDRVLVAIPLDIFVLRWSFEWSADLYRSNSRTSFFKVCKDEAPLRSSVGSFPSTAVANRRFSGFEWIGFSCRDDSS